VTVLDKMNWFVLRVATNREDSVRERLVKRIKADGLEHRIPQVIVPVERITEIKGGKKRVVNRKIYPGYIMIQARLGEKDSDDPEDQKVWFALHETPGLKDFVGGSGTVPTPMSDEEVESVLAAMQESEEAPKMAVKVKRGDTVRIKEGAFEGFDGTVEEILESQGKLRISVTIFGRATSVEIEHWLVEPV